MNKQDFLRSNGVSVDDAVENMIDFDTYYEILQDFYKEIDSIILKLTTSKDNGDMANYAIDVHALKSNVRSLGFMDLGDTCYEHELKSKDNNIDFINNNFADLIDKVNNMKKIIEECINL